MRWILWTIGFLGSLACIGLTAYLAITGHPFSHVTLAQAGAFIGVGILIAADPNHRR